MTVTYAASCSFVTPLEPACVLIFTPGRYRFFDFVKVGTILTIAVFAIVILLVPGLLAIYERGQRPEVQRSANNKPFYWPPASGLRHLLFPPLPFYA